MIDGQDDYYYYYYYYYYHWLWIAYEPNLDSYQMMHLLLERTIFGVINPSCNYEKNRCGNKPIFTLSDGARWYNKDAYK